MKDEAFIFLEDCFTAFAMTFIELFLSLRGGRQADTAIFFYNFTLL